LDIQSVLTQPVVLTFHWTDGGERNIHGNVRQVKLLEVGSDGMTAYEAEIVPWFWFLTLFSDCRIFQNMTVPDIVEEVFKGRGFTNFKSVLKSDYTSREYCVQYRETDFNFVSRLLEEEGAHRE
jgi:type VI secretion system secreted protein VgrG